MTVPVQTPYTYSTANGVTTVFPYGFKIAAEEDLVVVLDDVVQTSGYTVSGVGNPSGGNVTFSSPPANGVVVGRYLDPVLDRDTDYQQFGDWSAQNVNLDFDRIWIALQTIKQYAKRALKLRVDTADDQVITEAPDDRALKVIGFDALGKLKLYIAQVGTSLIDLSASTGASLIGFIQAGVGAVLRTIQDRLRDTVSVKDFGAVGDGVTDDTAAIRAAIAAVMASRYSSQLVVGGIYVGTAPTLYFPSGTYYISDYLTQDVAAGTQHLHVVGQSAIIKMGAGVTAFGGVGYMCTFEGLAFRGGNCGISVNTNNLDTTKILITNCEFEAQAVACIKSEPNSFSTVLVIDKCKFWQSIASVATTAYVLYLKNMDKVYLQNSWMTCGTTCAIYASNFQLHVSNTMFVPIENIVAAGGRWFDMYSEIYIRDSRFGAEGGGAYGLVYCHTDGLSVSRVSPWDPDGVLVVENSIVAVQYQPDGGAIVHAIGGMPSRIAVRNVSGGFGIELLKDSLTSGTLVANIATYAAASVNDKAQVSINVEGNMNRYLLVSYDATLLAALGPYLSDETYDGSYNVIRKFPRIKAAKTIGVGGADPATSGAGVTFPATQSASTDANTFDDYEEGVYVATLTPGTSGTVTLNASFDTLAYTKRGRDCRVQGQLAVSSVASPVGTYLRLSLPFTIADLTKIAGRVGGCFNYKNAPATFISTEGNTYIDLVVTVASVAASDNFYFDFEFVAA